MHVDDVSNIVREALALQDASLVIFRAKTLIEFKTKGLGAGLQHQVEDGYDTWQIGDFDGYHCLFSQKYSCGLIHRALRHRVSSHCAARCR